MKIIRSFLLMLLVTACSKQVGQSFDVDAVRAFQPGITTEQEAVATMGRPVAITTGASGNRLLQWQYVHAQAFGASGGTHVAVLFGPDGKLIRVAHIFEQ